MKIIAEQKTATTLYDHFTCSNVDIERIGVATMNHHILLILSINGKWEEGARDFAAVCALWHSKELGQLHRVARNHWLKYDPENKWIDYKVCRNRRETEDVISNL